MAQLKDSVLTGNLRVTDATLTDTLNVGGMKIFHGTCDTAAATVDKVVTCPKFTAADLTIGVIVFVTFDETNSGKASTLTMSVNNTTAANIKKVSNGAVSNLTAVGELLAGITYMFTYNGTYWVVLNSDYDTKTTCRQTRTSSDANRPLLLAYSGNTTTTTNVDNVTYRNNDMYANPSTGTVTVPHLVATTDITIGSTTITEAQLSSLIGILPANGVSF